jgi:hypothetical protein
LIKTQEQMRKLNEIKCDPELEQIFINYVGFTHLMLHAEDHLDPDSEYEPGLQELLYETMSKGAHLDLQRVLESSHQIAPNDPDWDYIVEEVSAYFVGLYGMDRILEDSKEFLRIINEPEYPEVDALDFVVHADHVCRECGQGRILLMPEDLPTPIFKTFQEMGLQIGTSWLCLQCHRITDEPGKR